jgi:hypothetical protein
MRHKVTAAARLLAVLLAAGALAACEDLTPQYPVGPGPAAGPPPVGPPPPAPAYAAPLSPPAAEAPPNSSANSRYGDSDEAVCNTGAPDDPRTVQACQRLHAPDSPDAGLPRPQARWGDSDEFRCNNGPRDDPRTAQACQRLRGAGDEAGR